MIVVGYCRVSSDGQADGSSLESQGEEIRAWASRGGHIVARVYAEAVSGAADVDARPVLQEALGELARLVADGEDARLVVVKRNRLARDVYVAAALERVTGKRVTSLDAEGEGPEADLMRSILDAFAAYERAQIAWRTALGRRKKRESGGWTGGRPPWGLRLEGSKVAQVLVPVDVDHARAVREVFTRHGIGVHLVDIARWLNATGWRTGDGAEWTHKQVSRVVNARKWYASAGVLPVGKRKGE